MKEAMQFFDVTSETVVELQIDESILGTMYIL